MPKILGMTPRLLIADVERIVRFYTQTLGFRLRTLWPAGHPSFAIVDRDGLSLQFVAADARREEQPQPGYTAYLDADDERAVRHG